MFSLRPGHTGKWGGQLLIYVVCLCKGQQIILQVFPLGIVILDLDGIGHHLFDRMPTQCTLLRIHCGHDYSQSHCVLPIQPTLRLPAKSPKR